MYKDHFDEDNYESARILIEKTPQEKVVKKVTKLLKPFAIQSQEGKLTKKNLVKDGWLDTKCKISEEEITEMGKQAELAYSLCNTIDEMDPDQLKSIEMMASGIQTNIEAKLKDIPEEERNNMNCTEALQACLGAIPQETMGDLTPLLGSLLSTVLPQERTSKESLMDSFSKIDGNVGKRR